jgi:flagellar hook-length control protein FliK
MENISILNLFSAQVNVEMPKAAADTGQGQFEDVFKKYLDRSGDDAQTLKTKDTSAAQDQKSVKAEEPETPEEVIDNLDIPEEQKAELKRMLSEAETEEDVSAFIDELMIAAQNESEDVLTQLALSVLGGEGTQTEQDTMILEQALDQIAAIQAQTNNQPQLTLVKNETTATNATDAAAQASAEGDEGTSKREMLLNLAQEKSSEQQLSAEMKQKIAELAEAAKGQKTEKVTTETSESGFTIKSETTEKVITTEIKIESPKDIMKFAELMELAKGQKANKLTVQLTPQELGKVNIELTEQAGKISGKITFESDAAKHLFTSNSEALRQQLADKGIIVENLEFVFKDFDQHEFAGWEGKEGKKSGSANGAGLLSDESDEEKSEEDNGIYA